MKYVGKNGINDQLPPDNYTSAALVLHPKAMNNAKISLHILIYDCTVTNDYQSIRRSPGLSLEISLTPLLLIYSFFAFARIAGATCL
jgi:hypothetical protein